MCERTPIKVKRVPIREASEEGWGIGGWYAFPRPDENTPYLKTKGKERVLWCPYCGAWTVFGTTSEFGVESCVSGVCGGISTNDFYTKKYNKLFN